MSTYDDILIIIVLKSNRNLNKNDFKNEPIYLFGFASLIRFIDINGS